MYHNTISILYECILYMACIHAYMYIPLAAATPGVDGILEVTEGLIGTLTGVAAKVVVDTAV